MSNQNKNDLKPCPCCGDKAKIKSYQTAEDEMTAWVECVYCEMKSGNMSDAYAPISSVISLWNTRPETPTQKTHESPVGDVEAAAYKAHHIKRELMFEAEVTQNEAEIAFQAGYLARGHVNAGWVEISDPIVETWKDGRNVDIISDGRRFTDANFTMTAFGGYWWIGNGHEIVNVTHAMLPPTPPTQAPKEP